MIKNKLLYLVQTVCLFALSLSAYGQTRVTIGTMRNSAVFNENLFISLDDGKVNVTGGTAAGRNGYSLASMPMTERAVMKFDFTQKHNNSAVDDKVQVTPSILYKEKYYTTLYAPYNLVVPDASTCSVYIPAYQNDRTIRVGANQLCAPNTIVPIGTGMIVVSNSSKTISFEISIDTPSTLPSSGLSGTSVPTPVYHFEPDAIYALSMKNGKLGFYHFIASQTASCKAFLTTEYTLISSNAKQIDIIFDDIATSMQAPADTDGDTRSYNTLGQRVKDDMRGIVIRNGKKLINK